MAVISFKCPNCDGELIFDPSSGKYKCEYCLSKFTQQELDALTPASGMERPAGGADGNAASPDTAGADGADGEHLAGGEEAALYSCPSCGAEIITDATTAATFCYYCNNPVVLGGRLEGKFLPNKIIPFQIDKKEAEKRFLAYVKKKKFVPRAFFNKRQITMLSGVYFPFWMYDARFQARMEAEAKKIRVWRTGDTEYTETKFYQLEREGKINLDHLAENALLKANKQLVEGVLPYQFDTMKDFTMGYLSGFTAEKRDIEKEALADGMRGEMQNYAKSLMRETISGYSSVNMKNNRLTVAKDTWNYVLLPVWTLTYKAKNGKFYYYSMNGQTGKVCGELPIDYKKLSLVSGIAAAVALGLGLLGGFLI